MLHLQLPSSEEVSEAVPEVAESAWEGFLDVLGSPPVMAIVRIVAIILIALVLRWLLFRAIRGFVESATQADLHERLASGRSGRLLLDVSGSLLAERRHQRVQTLGSTLRGMASTIVFVIALLMILPLLNLPSSPALATASIVAAALAFGAQNLVRDWLTGGFLIVEDQFGVGDSVDLGFVNGTIEAVGLRVTTLRDDNGVRWYIRNGEITRVGNRSQGWATANVDVPMAYDTDLTQAREVLLGVAAGLAAEDEWADDLIGPAKVLGVESLSPEAITLRITVRCAPGENFAVQRELRERIKVAFDAAGLRITAVTPPPPPPAP